jgi:hypothetical protein
MSSLWTEVETTTDRPGLAVTIVTPDLCINQAFQNLDEEETLNIGGRSPEAYG